MMLIGVVFDCRKKYFVKNNDLDGCINSVKTSVMLETIYAQVWTICVHTYVFATYACVMVCMYTHKYICLCNGVYVRIYVCAYVYVQCMFVCAVSHSQLTSSTG